jgi:hypothetical protein
MGLDHSQAFVRISFDGLIGFCICRRDDYRCEMGMVQAEDHDPLMSITMIHPNGTKTRIFKDRRLLRHEPIRIEALTPVKKGVSIFKGSVFDAPADHGDPEDFRWVMDLQGDLFHKEHLKLKQGTGDELLRPKITIPHGIFYTQDKTAVQFERFKLPNQNPVPIGKVADRVGADILSNFEKDNEGKDNKIVRVTIGEWETLLKFKIDETMGYTYKIRITNLCRRSGGGPSCPDESDFTQYYKVATDDDDIKYDVKPIFPQGDPRGKKDIPDFDDKNFPEFRGFRSNGPPQSCASSFFGKANFIP